MAVTGGPSPFLQLAGHPLRWQLLVELGRSDRRVHELVALTGEPQNLVSYHLGRLRDAGLVTSRRSSADRRDSYYRVELVQIRTMLADTAAALHPGLRPHAAGARRRRRPRVLFLCTGNSARSQMAEAIAVARSDGWIDARSAGSHPKPLHAEAVRIVGQRHGVDISGRRSKHVDSLAARRFDRVVTLCDRVREVCPDLPAAPPPVHWSMPDPSAADDVAAAFELVATDLESRIDLLIADLADPAEPTTRRSTQP